MSIIFISIWGNIFFNNYYEYWILTTEIEVDKNEIILTFLNMLTPKLTDFSVLIKFIGILYLIIRLSYNLSPNNIEKTI